MPSDPWFGCWWSGEFWMSCYLMQKPNICHCFIWIECNYLLDLQGFLSRLIFNFSFLALIYIFGYCIFLLPRGRRKFSDFQALSYSTICKKQEFSIASCCIALPDAITAVSLINLCIMHIMFWNSVFFLYKSCLYIILISFINWLFLTWLSVQLQCLWTI